MEVKQTLSRLETKVEELQELVLQGRHAEIDLADLQQLMFEAQEIVADPLAVVPFETEQRVKKVAEKCEYLARKWLHLTARDRTADRIHRLRRMLPPEGQKLLGELDDEWTRYIMQAREQHLLRLELSA